MRGMEDTRELLPSLTERSQKQKRNQSTGGGKLWRKEDTGKRKEEGTTSGEEDRAKESHTPEDRCRGKRGENQADLKVNSGNLSPASASPWIIDFDPSEPAALHGDVTVFIRGWCQLTQVHMPSTT